MLIDIFATIAPILCVAIGIWYMYRIVRQVRPLLRRLDELKKWEDRVAAWELEHATWEGKNDVKLEPEGRRERRTDSEDLPF